MANMAHGRIYQALLDCAEVGEAIDVVTVANRLQRNGGPVGKDLAYLGTLAANTPSAFNVKRYAEIVRERAMDRDLLAALGEAADIVHNGSLSARDKIEQIQAKVMSITEAQGRDPAHIADTMPAYREALAARGMPQAGGIQTHFPALDRKLGMLRPGNLIIVAGRPSMGKSALGFQLAERAAMQKHRVLILSMEMTNEEVQDRLVSGVTGIPLEELVSGKEKKHPHVEAALRTIAAWPLYVDDSPALTLMGVRAKARSVKRRHGLGLVVVDYLQLMSGTGENRNAVIEEISRCLKALAKELHVPVVALSQLSRKCDERNDKRPMLSDLRDSGALEQDADVVMFVYREELYRPNAAEWRGLAEILIKKHRQGQTGDVHLTWRGALTRFDNFSGEWPADRTVQRRQRGIEE